MNPAAIAASLAAALAFGVSLTAGRESRDTWQTAGLCFLLAALYGGGV